MDRKRLAVLAQDVELAFFEYWLSDYAGHHQDMAQAVTLLESFDSMLAGLLQSWNDAEGLILITSDHGNLEDLSTRRHTQNPVPALLIGKPEHRQRFSAAAVKRQEMIRLIVDAGFDPLLPQELTQPFPLAV